jgi:hypothetical protein
MYKLCPNSFQLHPVDSVYERPGKGIFHSKKNTNLLHVILQLVTDMPKRAPVWDLQEI